MEQTAQQKKKTTETYLYYAGLALLIPAAALAFLYYSGILHDIIEAAAPCVFNHYTGLYCPGCGGTRATISFLQGHLIRSLLYHPIVPYVAGCYVIFMLSQTIARLTKGKGIFGLWKKGMLYHDRYVYIGIALLVANFFLRNLVYLTTGLTYLD